MRNNVVRSKMDFTLVLGPEYNSVKAEVSVSKASKHDVDYLSEEHGPFPVLFLTLLNRSLEHIKGERGYFHGAKKNISELRAQILIIELLTKGLYKVLNSNLSVEEQMGILMPIMRKGAESVDQFDFDAKRLAEASLDELKEVLKIKPLETYVKKALNTSETEVATSETEVA